MAPAPRAADKSKKKSAEKPATKPVAKAATRPPARTVIKPAAPSRTSVAKATGRPASAGSKHIATPPAPVVAQPDLYSSLHALLHTMRVIEQHDEPLCSMHDELKRTGRLSAFQRRRLQQLVDELPAEDYQADLETLRQAVATGKVPAA